ncbi:MAG TPA: hypothetical protein VLQ79_06680, partial [Myxococcaceae bacterium]|nr:hypothetical protein [Myxococcaceae bacterium]
MATVSRGGLLAFTDSMPARARDIAASQAAVSPAAGPEMRAAAAPTGSFSGGGTAVAARATDAGAA